MAYRKGEDSDEALMGAMLEAEAFRCQRFICAFFEGVARAKVPGAPASARKRRGRG